MLDTPMPMNPFTVVKEQSSQWQPPVTVCERLWQIVDPSQLPHLFSVFPLKMEMKIEYFQTVLKVLTLI